MKYCVWKHLYWWPFFLAHEGEWPQKVAEVTFSRHCEHHVVFIECQHQRCSSYSLRQGTGATLTLGNTLFAASSACCFLNFIFAELPSKMGKSNTKLNCTYVLKHRNTLWLGSSYTFACQIWYSSKWGRIQRKKLYTVCLCLCAHAWVKLCVLIISVWAYLVLLLWHVLAYDQRKQVVWVGTAVPWVFKSKFLLLSLKVPKGESGRSQMLWQRWNLATTCYSSFTRFGVLLQTEQ